MRRVLDQQAGTGRVVPARCEVRLLGGVQLIGASGPVDLPDDVRVLLGLLALRPDRPLSAAALSDALRLDTPPRPLDDRIRDLAAGFAACGLPDVLRREADGYVLRLAGRRIDAVRFGRLLHRARTWMAAGEPARAGGLFALALRLWRPDRPDRPEPESLDADARCRVRR